MGLASDGTHKAFPSHLVDAFFNRPRIGDIRRHIDFEHHENTNVRAIPCFQTHTFPI